MVDDLLLLQKLPRISNENYRELFEKQIFPKIVQIFFGNDIHVDLGNSK